eukprot:COSAG06_NODE_60207_length_271_cov_1.465116_1_plen_29_part_10
MALLITAVPQSIGLSGPSHRGGPDSRGGP